MNKARLTILNVLNVLSRGLKINQNRCSRRILVGASINLRFFSQNNPYFCTQYKYPQSYMSQIKIHIHPPCQLNEIGKRENNEDNIYPAVNQATIEDRLFVVCDGVGGSNKGEIASKIVCDSFGDFVKEQEESKEINADFFTEALRAVEHKMSLYEMDHPACKGMKTTLTLVWFRPEGAWVAWCGDSRIYQFRNGRIVYKSEDHSLVNKLLKEGQITEEEAQNHPHGNVILRAIAGEREPAELDVVLLDDLRPGDIFMLCSDGITEKLTDANLSELASLEDVEMMQEQVAQFCETFSRDNYSMYLVGLRNVEEIVVQVEPETVETPDTHVDASDTPEESIEATPPSPMETPSVEESKENNLVKYVLGGLSIMALMVGVFSILDFNKKKQFKALTEKANHFRQNNQLDSAKHYLSLLSNKKPDDEMVKESLSEVEVLIDRENRANSLEQAHLLSIQTIDNQIQVLETDTTVVDTIQQQQLKYLFLKKDLTNAMYQFNLGDKEAAFELLAWKDTLAETRRIFQYENWETLAGLYGLFADGDSSLLARQAFCESFLEPVP